MTKRTIPKQSFNSVMSSSSPPSTPTHKQRKYSFATPTSHHYTTPTSHHNMFDDDDIDQDTSPYSRSYSQIAGAEVTWGKRKTPVPSKSKPYVPPDTTPPLSKRFFENDDEKPRTPCGFFKFKKKWEEMRLANSELNTDSGQDVSNTDTVASITEVSANNSNFITALEDIEATTSKISNSINLKQFLDDSIDMDLIRCSQKIEQDMSRIVEPIVNQPIASKGFVDGLNSNDNDDSLFDDPLLLDDNVLMQKSIYPRHKSMYPTSTNKPNDTSRITNSNNVKAVASCSVVPTPSNSSAQSLKSQPFSRHKSMPSPSMSVSASTKQCTPQEIEMKRQQAIARLKQRNKLK